MIEQKSKQTTEHFIGHFCKAVKQGWHTTIFCLKHQVIFRKDKITSSDIYSSSERYFLVLH